MTRECHVRICERLGVRVPGPTRRPRAKYGAAKRVYFRGADLVSLKRRQHRPMTYWLAWDEPRAVGDLVHVETFFAGNLGGLIHARTRMPAGSGRRQAARRACRWM